MDEGNAAQVISEVYGSVREIKVTYLLDVKGGIAARQDPGGKQCEIKK